MSEGDYEYECMRCDLLGLVPPDRATFEATRTRPQQVDRLEDGEETIDTVPEAEQDIDLKDEHLKNASGGLDELNNILSMTQKKINKFKVVCGSFTNLLRLKVSGRGEESQSECSSRGSIASDTEGQRENEQLHSGDLPSQVKPRDSDVSSHVESQVDKLDSLLMKAEKAHISMTSQNKEMKAFLK